MSLTFLALSIQVCGKYMNKEVTSAACDTNMRRFCWHNKVKSSVCSWGVSPQLLTDTLWFLCGGQSGQAGVAKNNWKLIIYWNFV